MQSIARGRKSLGLVLALALVFSLVPILSLPAGAVGEVVISEIRVDEPSTDNSEYLELSGAPGTSLSGMTYLVIGDGTGGSGVIEAEVDLNPFAIQSSGFFVAAESTFTLGVPDATATLDFENSDNVTHLLVSDFTGTKGDDLDTDDDGTLDVTPWTAIHDSVGLVETVGSGELLYSTTLVGPDGTFAPGHVHLCSSGWEIAPFDLGIVDTPGAANRCNFASIYDIQFTTDPSGDSPYVGMTPLTEGVVTAVFPGSSAFVIQDGTGPFSGLYVYDPDTYPVVGDHVYVEGAVSEYYGLTEITGAVTISSSGNPLPAPEVLATAAMAVEDWESVLVRAMNVTVTDDALGFGEWEIDDGSGPVAVDDDGVGFYTYVPVNGDSLDYVQGPLNYTYDAFKIAPRSDADILIGSPVTHTIYEIQYTTDASGDSPYVGVTVVTEGVVTAVLSSGFIMQDGTGPFSGLYVYSPDVFPEVGDHVYVEGPITEYYNLTELTPGAVTINSSGNPLPAPEVLATAAMAVEDWESVLVRAMNVTVTDDALGFGEWEIDDGSGPVAVDDDGVGFYTYVPVNGDSLDYVQGFLNYTYDAFKIAPRSDADIQMASPVTHTIYEIQYTTDASGDSPYVGVTVVTEGVVTAVLSSGFIMQDGTGPFSGLYVYSPDVFPEVGDHVYVEGPITEYYNLTELTPGAVTINSSGNPLPAPEVLATAAMAVEDWESVLVRAMNVTVTDDALGFGEWEIDDGSGPVAVDDDGVGFYTYVPVNGDSLDYVQGFLNYTYDAFKIAPRSDADIQMAGTTAVLINEVDADTPGTDAAEFVELYDGGLGNLPLDGLVVVFYNGSDDQSYAAYDLDGYTTDANGFFVLGNTGVSPDLEFGGGGLQNGVDAVALFFGDAADFPNDTPITTDGLVDAIVYDTNDSDNPALLALLNPGQPQVNEAGGGAGDLHSNSRCPDGTGGARNTDTYTQIPPTPGALNDCGVEPEVCGEPFTPVYDIQGSGDASPLDGAIVSVEAVVTGIFPDLDGFYIQDPDGDGDPATSDGIFVYDLGSSSVAVGDLVRIGGAVSEYQTLTEITAAAVLVCGVDSVAATPVTLPRPAGIEWEQYEGMLVSFDTLTVTETYNLGLRGEIMLSAPDRLWNPTEVVAPGAPALALQADNDRSFVTLNDGSGVFNPTPIPYLVEADPVRLGDTVAGLTGVIDGYQNTYGLNPTMVPAFVRTTPRPAAPDGLGSGLTVASFNLYNYWNTFGGRGASDADEYAKQEAKLAAAIAGFDADVIGLQELENDGDGPDSSVADLVDLLNGGGAGPWDYVRDPAYSLYPDGILSTNAIKVGIIYRTDRVTPIGDPQISEDVSFSIARPPFGQVFEYEGSVFSVISNHFKSKGCSDAGGLDLDQGDGQSCYNATRTAQAVATLDFVSHMQALSGSDDVVMVGDLNSYGLEDPIVALRSGGLIDLTDDLARADRYSYVYQGQMGRLDFAFATPSMVDSMTGLDIWHINADEPRAMGYNVYEDYHTPDPYRSSDHDPVLATFVLNAPPVADAGGPYVIEYGSDLVLDGSGSSDPDGDALTYGWDLDGDGVDDATGATPTVLWADLVALGFGLGDFTVELTVDDGALEATDTAALSIVDTTPPECTADFDPILVTYRSGWFRIQFGCEDAVDPNPVVEATLNGYPISDGQFVYLRKSGRKTRVYWFGDLLIMKAKTFELIVTGTDASGNEGTASAEPTFRKKRPWRHWWL